MSDTYAQRVALAKDRKEASDLYADAMLALGMASDEWPDINKAIMQRWSRSGLIWIKNRAWRTLKGQQ